MEPNEGNNEGRQGLVAGIIYLAITFLCAFGLGFLFGSKYTEKKGFKKEVTIKTEVPPPPTPGTAAGTPAADTGTTT